MTQARLNQPLSGIAFNKAERQLISDLAAGGDARIALRADTGLNKYLSAPYPRGVIAFSSSTVNDISAEAFAHIAARKAQAPSYADWLGDIGQRIKAAFAIGNAAEIIFAPSGTDLEYAALACVTGRAAGGVHNVLLGADEIGSGCVLSARARYFAEATALGISTKPGSPIAGFGDVSMVDIPVRCDAGIGRSSAAITSDMAREIERAASDDKHSLVHGVHGSKTGLVLPSLSDIDALQARFGDAVTFVIDACQARITQRAIAAYLARGAIVLMTGSKFVGAPPFNGWALVPQSLMKQASPLPEGLKTIARRAEWPALWPGAGVLDDVCNLSLALRLEAAAFEIERFQRVPIQRVTAVIAAFEAALMTHCIEPLGAKRVCPGDARCSAAMPIEMRTLATLDVSSLAGLATFEEAQAIHAKLALGGIRLGQPVKCVRLPDGHGWGGTLRIGLSMPMIVRWASASSQKARDEIETSMARIAEAILEASGAK